jgi:hypothetical protein
MRYLFLTAWFCGALLACEQKQAVSTETTNPIPTHKAPTKSTAKTFTVGVLNEENVDVYGGLALADPSKQGTIAYVNERSNTGEIQINGKKIPLNKVSSKNGSYLLMGPDVLITTTQATYDEQAEGDCFYGLCKAITITYKGAKLNVDNINVQDCLSLGI